jgi:hypothetical protein
VEKLTKVDRSSLIQRKGVLKVSCGVKKCDLHFANKFKNKGGRIPADIISECISYYVLMNNALVVLIISIFILFFIYDLDVYIFCDKY